MQFKFEKVKTEFYPVEVGFRPNTIMVPLKMAFMFINGGGGDYFTWLRPIQWLCQEATWIHGQLFVPDYLLEIANYFISPYPNWKVMSYEDMKKVPQDNNTPLRGPIILEQQALNATGGHLINCGWVYFCNKEKAPSHNSAFDGLPWHHYPKFKQSDLDAVGLPEAARDLLPGRYAVITTGVTTPSRNVKPEYWNHVIEYVKSLGLTPVFLGKRVTTTGNTRNIHTQYSNDLKLNLGVDLIDQTTLMQAASIMSRAAVVIGHDNGLLHLAGMTEVPIVFSYNLASPEHRRPIRLTDKTYDVFLRPDELACTFCQSKTNFVIAFNFRQCFYGDLKCMDLLFANKAEKWRKAIDDALGT